MSFKNGTSKIKAIMELRKLKDLVLNIQFTGTVSVNKYLLSHQKISNPQDVINYFLKYLSAMAEIFGPIYDKYSDTKEPVTMLLKSAGYQGKFNERPFKTLSKFYGKNSKKALKEYGDSLLHEYINIKQKKKNKGDSSRRILIDFIDDLLETYEEARWNLIEATNSVTLLKNYNRKPLVFLLDVFRKKPKTTRWGIFQRKTWAQEVEEAKNWSNTPGKER